MTQRLTIACTPDSDDAFYYFALETGRLGLPGFRLEFCRQPLSVLNQAALGGNASRACATGREGVPYDVTAISSVLYPLVADRYAVLSVGTSVGRGYGPVLVSQRWRTVAELRGRRVGVGGIPTTGWFLLRSVCPEAVPVEMPFDRIADAVAAGDLDAGVMIHEELLYYPQVGLHRVADLGQLWCDRNGLPLPVGLNVARRDLGLAVLQRVCGLLRRSLLYGLEHRDEALAWVRRFGRGPEGQCTERFVALFANEDSVRMPADVREALRVVCWEAVEQGIGNAVPALDIIDAGEPAALAAG